jgi:hypothetical protein
VILTCQKIAALSEDGSLILHAIYNGTDKYLFNLISRRYSEEYIIRFGRLDMDTVVPHKQ